MIDKHFWKGKKVFLTGHTGFKGSWMALWLHKMGAIVRGYALDPIEGENIFEMIRLQEILEKDIRADIRNQDQLIQSVKEFQPEIVFHLAAQPLVRASYDDPLGTYSTNVMGTANLLDVIRKVSSVKSVVIVTTDKCYENKEWLWGYREDEPLGGFDPYSNSKACAELVTAAYRNSFFNPAQYTEHGVAIASARAGNVIGGGDYSKDRLIPDIVKAINSGKKVQIRNPRAIRPWQHVLEPISGYLLLGQKLFVGGVAYSQAWNFGPRDEDAKEVLWIVENMTKLWKNAAGYEIDRGHHPHEAKYLKLDTSKARQTLEWKPVWNLETTLQKIYEWEIAPLDSKREFTLKQIDEYIK